jgi:CubicO group peptidase (beta-lactamase class C family)
MMRIPAALFALLVAGCATISPQPIARAQVGVAFDRNGELGNFAEGFADRQAARRITIDDPARVASVTKLVVAIGVMKLVEAGLLDLDRDVSGYLGWRLRNPSFPDQPISLRKLLSHTSSVREHDDNYVLPLGASLEQAMQDPGEWDP